MLKVAIARKWVSSGCPALAWRRGWPSLSASEQGIGLFWGAATSAAITRSRSMAADHKAPVALVMSGFIGMAGHPETQSCSRHINCEFYRLNVNLRPLVRRPMPLKI
jgi:hypothetical protein